jgi:hypothetical protein
MSMISFRHFAAAALCIAACQVAAAGAGSAAAQPGSAMEALASPPHGLIRQRAAHFYRMPDGTIWDGWNQQEFISLVRRHLSAVEVRRPGTAAPGIPLRESRAVRTEWRVARNLNTEAWGFFRHLAMADTAVISGKRLEAADRRKWKDAPPLWSSRDSGDFTWDFALIDERSPDPYTRREHGSYLKITRIWGDGEYEVEGYSLDLGRISGIVTIHDPQSRVQRDRLRGEFFLWPGDVVTEPGGFSRRSWTYIPASELRLTAEELADVLINGSAEIAEWKYRRISGRLIWERSVRPVELAVPRAAPERPAHVPPPAVGADGPDLIVLRDHRWYRGRLVREDDEHIVFAVRVGDLESEMTFARDDVAEVQSPERRDP